VILRAKPPSARSAILNHFLTSASTSQNSMRKQSFGKRARLAARFSSSLAFRARKPASSALAYRLPPLGRSRRASSPSWRPSALSRCHFRYSPHLDASELFAPASISLFVHDWQDYESADGASSSPPLSLLSSASSSRRHRLLARRYRRQRRARVRPTSISRTRRRSTTTASRSRAAHSRSSRSERLVQH
jgi:hypothetical protein